MKNGGQKWRRFNFKTLTFIEVLFDTEILTMLVTEERLEEIKILVKTWLKLKSATLES